jgi:hypothetical protein
MGRVTYSSAIDAHARRGPVRRLLHALFPPSVRRRVWLWLSQAGVLADAYMWLDPRVRLRRVSRSTDLVIDGMARSSNSYSYVALLYAHGDTLSIAHHLHTPRAIERGVKLGLPTIVLIREPRAVLASVIQFDEGGLPSYFLDAYLSYYRRVEPLIDRVVLADFTEVISDFGAVIDRCNERYGTSFKRYERSPEGEAWIKAKIDDIATQIVAPEDVEAKTPMPSARRRSVDDVLGDLGPDDQKALAEAEQLYARLRSTA